MHCWHCGNAVNWNCDYDLEDITGEHGILTLLVCTNEDCGASYECTLPLDKTGEENE